MYLTHRLMKLILILLSLDVVSNQLRRKIAVLINKQIDLQDLIKENVNLVFRNCSSADVQVELEAEFVEWSVSDFADNEVNQLQVINDLICPRLLSDFIAVLIVQTSQENQQVKRDVFAAVARTLGFYRVPVLGLLVRSADFSKQDLYPTFVKLSASYASEAVVFIQMLNHLNYHQVVLLTIRDDIDGQEFVALFERLAENIHLEVSDLLIESVAAKLADVTPNTIILNANQDYAQQIFSELEQLNQTGRVWIINEAASYAKNVPKGFLSVRMRLDLLGSVRNAAHMLHSGAQLLAQFNHTEMPPSQCRKTLKTANEWTNTIGMQFFNKLANLTVQQDPMFEIVNAQDRLEVVGFMNRHSLLTLNEWEIVWPGDATAKPLEINLPKHLRCFTVLNDPPFVFSFAVANETQCINYKNVQIDGIHVPGSWHSCIKKVGPSHETMPFCCAGYAIDLLVKLAEMRMFTFDLYLNDSYGAVLLGDRDGYYLSGMLGELDAGHGDLAIGAISINPERKRYVDLTIPWLYHGIQILEKWPHESPLSSLTQPFRKSLWFVLLVSVMLIGLVIYVLDLKSPFEKFKTLDNDDSLSRANHRNLNTETRLTFGEAFWFVWGVLLNSGVSEKTPKSFSGRLLGIAWSCFCLIFIASFTANLAVFLVLYDEQDKNLNGIDDLRFRNPSANFTFGTVLNTNTYQYFKRHIELSTMFRKMENHNFETSAEAIQALLNNSLGAFIWDSVRLDFEASKNCDLRTRGPVFGRSAYAVALQKNSPWTKHMSAAILQLTEGQELLQALDGTLLAFHEKWILSGGLKKCQHQIRKKPARLSMHNMYEGFVLLGLGVLFGIVMSVVEIYLSRQREKQRKSKLLAQNYALKWRSHLRPLSQSETLDCSQISDQARSNKLLCCFTTPSDSKTSSQRSISLQAKQNTATDKNKKVFVPELNFGTQPSRVYCSKCRKAVCTVPIPVLGLFAVICSVICILLFLWPCALMPGFLQCFADFEHRCPICSHVVGKYRRGRSPKFYV